MKPSLNSKPSPNGVKKKRKRNQHRYFLSAPRANDNTSDSPHAHQTSSPPPHTPKDTQPPPSAQTTDHTSDDAQKRSVQWCRAYSHSALVPFAGSWILTLTSDEPGAIPDKAEGRTHVAVHGLCPFHVISSRNPDGSVDCAGCLEHTHETPAPSAPCSAPLLNVRLVTQPVPMDVLLRSSELSHRALYFFHDTKFSQMYPNALAKSLAAQRLTPERFHLTKPPAIFFANPRCHRALQRQALAAEYRLDDELGFSIDEWTNVIGNQGNVKLFERGSRVPLPRDPRFRARGPALSLAFATDFQHDMFAWYLANDSGPCYLDAAFSFALDGFQLWTLFFERNATSIPLSFLVTTAVDVRLVGRWLEELVARRDLPRKTLYVNSMALCDSLVHILHSWDVRLGKYCVVQELRAHILRPRTPQVANKRIRRAVAGLRGDFAMSIAIIRDNKTLAGRLPHIFDNFDQWFPRSKDEVGLFDQSLDALCRWRYLLWATTLGRPHNSRIDIVLYYLCRHILPGVEQLVSAFPSSAHSAPAPFDMDSLEFGNFQRHELLKGFSLTNLGDDVFCLAPERNLIKVIVDLGYDVCFCDGFREKGMCEHLIYCSPDRIHQPEVIQLTATMPFA
ncbi:hypothetical protein IW150_003357 [Coemansia sp. RSA 2607]|nr:hypothetical protein IW150_003357 [Coemansia sp. RSA 2607]